MYCGRSCRQRAYESRQQYGAQLLPLVPAPNELRTLGYHAGRVTYGEKEHAVVVGALTPRDFRALCGAVVRPLPRPFGPLSPTACKRCVALSMKYPPIAPVRTFVDAIVADEIIRRAS